MANIQEVYGPPVVVAINKFPLDTEAELEAVYESCKKRNVDVVISDVWAHGGAGGRDLAEKVIQLAQEENHFSYVCDEEDSIETKLTKIVTKVYGGKGISLTPAAKRELKDWKLLASQTTQSVWPKPNIPSQTMRRRWEHQRFHS